MNARHVVQVLRLILFLIIVVDIDGIGNNADTDDDGVADGDDAFPLDNSESVDTDGDGTGNNADTDADGDGVSDSTWVQLGEDIDGEAAGDLAGFPQLSSDGTVVAIGGLLNNGSDPSFRPCTCL